MQTVKIVIITDFIIERSSLSVLIVPLTACCNCIIG